MLFAIILGAPLAFTISVSVRDILPVLRLRLQLQGLHAKATVTGTRIEDHNAGRLRRTRHRSRVSFTATVATAAGGGCQEVSRSSRP